MNWKLILGVIGTVAAVGLVLWTSCGTCTDSSLNARMGRKSADPPPTATPPGAAAAATPAASGPANPTPAAAAPKSAGNTSAPVASPAPVFAGGSLAAPPRQRNEKASPNAEERIRHTLVRMNRIQVAIDDYCRANGGKFPTAICGADGKTPMLSWRVAILPYLGYGELYQKFSFAEPWDGPNNQKLLGEIPVFYQSPERGDEKTNYLGGPVLTEPRVWKRDDIQDGLEHTLLFVEADDFAAVPWTEPRDFQSENYRASLGRLRSGSFFAVWCSGLVSSIPARVTAPQINGAFTPSGEDSDSYLNLSEAVGPRPSGGGIAATTPPIPRGIEDPENPATIRPTPVASPSSRPANPGAPAGAAGLKSLDEMGALARGGIQRGQEARALLLAYATAALDSNPKGYSAQIQWVPALRRPAMGVRFGIGVEMATQPGSGSVITASGKEKIVPKKMNSTLAQGTGELGERLVYFLETGISDGAFGSLLQECANSPALPLGNIQFEARETIHSNEYFFPGISYVGRGNEKQLLAWAQQDAIDVLIIFNVDNKVVARGQINYSETTLSIFDVVKGAELFRTPTPLNSRKVWVDRQAEKEGRDPVATFLDKPFTYIEQNLRMTDLPPNVATQPTIAKRIESLLTSDPRDRLTILAEIRSYQSRGLIDATAFKAACRKLLDDDAADKLAAEVPFETRLKAVDRWMPKLRIGPPVVEAPVTEFDP